VELSWAEIAGWLSSFNCVGCSEWLNKWQTLISGLAAVAAAGISIRYLSKQIRQTDQHEQARLRRRHAAARATLPLALSQICGYAETAVREMDILRCSLNSETSPPAPGFSRPEPPIELVASLERMIEATDNASVTRVLSDIIIEMQVLAANLVALSGEEGRRRSARPNIDAYMVRAAKVYALASSLFPYARGEQDRMAKLDINAEVVRSLKLMHLNEIDHARAFELAQRAPSGTRSGGETSA